MKITNPQIFQLHGELCKVLASAKRLMIIALLSKRELSVGEIAEATDTSLPAISQHLRVLRERNMVTTRKDGQTVYYTLADQRLMDACVIIRRVLLNDMRRHGTLAQEIDPDGVTMDE